MRHTGKYFHRHTIRIIDRDGIFLIKRNESFRLLLNGSLTNHEVVLVPFLFRKFEKIYFKEFISNEWIQAWINYHLTITDPWRLDMSCTSNATQTAVLLLCTKCDNAHVVTYNNPTAINDDHQLLEANINKRASSNTKDLIIHTLAP